MYQLTQELGKSARKRKYKNTNSKTENWTYGDQWVEKAKMQKYRKAELKIVKIQKTQRYENVKRGTLRRAGLARR